MVLSLLKPQWLLSALIGCWWSQLVSLERLPLLCEESWDEKQTSRVSELGLDALCRHNFGRNVTIGALSTMPVSEWAFFQHEENNDNNYNNNDIEINIFITVMRNFHFRVRLVRMQQIQKGSVKNSVKAWLHRCITRLSSCLSSIHHRGKGGGGHRGVTASHLTYFCPPLPQDSRPSLYYSCLQDK